MRNNNQYYVYILTNRSNKVLYIGVTNDLVRRIFEHKNKLAEGFSKKYNLTKLVYYETTIDVESAISKEKQLKNWHRDWKINLINRVNPEWRDLGEDIGVCKLKQEIPKQVRDDTFGVRDARINQMNFRSKGGFTLIELVITMVLMAIVALIVANALSTVIKGSLMTDDRKEAMDQARIAMERMTREIRDVRRSADITTATATTFTFVDTSGTPISFALSGGNITRTSGTTNTLATGISIGTFATGIFKYVLTTGAETEDATASLTLIKRVKIDFKATKNTETITLQSEVWPRNL